GVAYDLLLHVVVHVDASVRHEIILSSRLLVKKLPENVGQAGIIGSSPISVRLHELSTTGLPVHAEVPVVAVDIPADTRIGLQLPGRGNGQHPSPDPAGGVGVVQYRHLEEVRSLLIEDLLVLRSYRTQIQIFTEH